MELNIKTLLLIAILGVVMAWFVPSRCTRQRGTMSTSSVEVIFDTMAYENIDPVEVTYIPSLPETDSLYTFRDTVDGRWSAEVTGHNVNLRSFVMVDRQETQYSTTYEPPAWEVSLKAAINPYTQWVGVGVSRSFGRMTLSLDGGYDYWAKTPYVGVEASVAIWRE